MAEVKPFPGLIYNSAAVKEISGVFCPPYDVISPEMQESLYNRHPFNVVRIELGKPQPDDSENSNVYTRARYYLQEWLKKGILIRDAEPYFYLYQQDFSFENRTYHRPGIVAAVRIEDFDKKVILPHEKTLPKARKDRFELLKTTETNVSQIFGFFSDETRKARSVIASTIKSSPVYSFTDEEGVTHTLYRIPPQLNQKLIEALNNTRIYIADGHHRYETALNYRNYMREKHGYIPDAFWEYVMITLVPVESDLLILPIHRLVHTEPDIKERQLINQLSQQFKVTPMPGSHHLKEALEKTSGFGVFGMVTGSNTYLLEYTGNSGRKYRLEAELLLHEVLIPYYGIKQKTIEDTLTFTSSFREAIKAPRRGEASAAFIMRPVPVETVKEFAEAGMTMPQKTTYFYPKVWTGLVMRSAIEI